MVLAELNNNRDMYNIKEIFFPLVGQNAQLAITLPVLGHADTLDINIIYNKSINASNIII